MSISQKVVARFRNGRVLKGQTHNFSPNRPTFRLTLGVGATDVTVHMDQLKAVFFVKSLVGNRHRGDVRGFLSGPAENAHGVKMAVIFDDKECLCGHSMSYAPRRIGFFMFPSDPESNNLKIFVVVQSIVEVRIGEQAEAMAIKFRTQAA